MLYKSDINLYKGIENFFLEERDLILFSAYIKTKIIEDLNVNKNLKQIVVRWEIEDLVKGVSDLDLYHYCQENNIQLFRNQRIHLKATWNYDSQLIFGSANYTGKGLGLKKNFNYELCGLNQNLSFEDKIYLNSILNSSQLVDDSYYDALKTLVNSIPKPSNFFPEFEFEGGDLNHFLLSQLPMSLSPDDLYDVVLNINDYGSLEQNCAAHDIALYSIDPFKEYTAFKAELRYKFNSHPFVSALKKHIKSQVSQSLNYGRVVEWIQANTTSVPTPRRWEIKKDQIVNILYTWICIFDDDFSWNVPGARSEVIYYNNAGDSELEGFINNLKRDKARGFLAPHQVILLIALFDVYKESKSSNVKFETLYKKFSEVWETYKNLFKSDNPELGMPLKVFYEKVYISLTLTSNINFRKNESILNSVDQVTISEKLISLFNLQNSRDYFLSRIDN